MLIIYHTHSGIWGSESEQVFNSQQMFEADKGMLSQSHMGARGTIKHPGGNLENREGAIQIENCIEAGKTASGIESFYNYLQSKPGMPSVMYF